MFKHYLKDLASLKKNEFEFNTTHLVDNLVLSAVKLCAVSFFASLGKTAGKGLVEAAEGFVKRNEDWIKAAKKEADLEEVEVVEDKGEANECEPESAKG